METVDLLYWGKDTPPTWTLGQVHHLPADAAGMAAWVQANLPTSTAYAWLFWDGSAGAPDAQRVRYALSQPGHVWHAGLCFGMLAAGQALDFVKPTWMHNAPSDPAQTISSWRLSLRAALIPLNVLWHIGGFQDHFTSVAGMALEFGYACVQTGVIIRHWPDLLLPFTTPLTSEKIPLADELRLLRAHFPRFWTLWAAGRMALTGYASPVSLLRTWVTTRSQPRQLDNQPYPPPLPQLSEVDTNARVSVLIPTIGRYPYLRVLLGQLAEQSIPPHQVIIVDQTPAAQRERAWAEEFPQLPILYLELDEAGQCRSRNLGLTYATGEYLLFVDDDDELPPDFILRHLFILWHYQADVSSGVVYEPNQKPSDVQRPAVRLSSVFPTNNTLLRRAVLEKTGGFDLAYDRRARADGDLGMRVHLSGHLMLLDERYPILHHHAPSGGLRTHKARVITRRASQQSLFKRHLVAASELYLAGRYFTPRQVHEDRLIRLFSVLSGERKFLKILVNLLLLPHTLWHFRQQQRLAAEIAAEFPQIPSFAPYEHE